MTAVRLGLISDVHGNVFALRAVLAELARLDVDVLVCAGDLVGYGPHPNECVQAVVDHSVRCVAGNHDLMAAGLLPVERCSRLAAASQRWTRSVLSDETACRLRALPAALRIGPVVVTHGALGDPQRYTATEEHAAAELERLAEDHPGATVLVLGHTHRQWVHRQGHGVVRAPRGHVALGAAHHMINPGSVGQSRQWELRPRARFAVLDLATRTAHFHAVTYDVSACAAALDRIGMPSTAMHSRPGVGSVLRRARRTLGPRAEVIG